MSSSALDHQQKIRKYLAEVPGSGFTKLAAAPLLYRLAWWLGVPVRPPVFQSWQALTLSIGLPYGIFISLIMWWIMWPGWENWFMTPILVVCCGPLFGLFMSGIYVRRAVELRLPDWEDYGNDESVG